MIGIEFTYKNGDKESYDPINYPDDFEETETYYILNMAYKYEILKDCVESMRHYNLCENCEFEIKYCRCDGR